MSDDKNHANPETEGVEQKESNTQNLSFPLPPPFPLKEFIKYWEKPMIDLGPVTKVMMPEKRFNGVRARVYLANPAMMPPISLGTTITYRQEYCSQPGNVRYMAKQNRRVEDGIAYVVFVAYNRHQTPYPLEHEHFHPIIIVCYAQLVRIRVHVLAVMPVQSSVTPSDSAQTTNPSTDNTAPPSRLSITSNIEVEHKAWYAIFAFAVLNIYNRLRLWFFLLSTLPTI